MAHNITPSDDIVSTHRAHQPTEPGFYKYEGARGSLIFCLDSFGNWWAVTDSPSVTRCVWAYIEQGLSVETLVRV